MERKKLNRIDEILAYTKKLKFKIMKFNFLQQKQCLNQYSLDPYK